MIGVDHDLDAITHRRPHHGDPGQVLLKRRIAHLDLDGPKALGDCPGADLLYFGVAVIEPADHGIGADALVHPPPQLPAGRPQTLAQRIPQGSIHRGNAEHRQAGRAVILGLAQHLLVQMADKAQLLAKHDWFEFVFDQGGQRGRCAGNAAKTGLPHTTDTVVGTNRHLDRTGTG